MPSLPPDLRCIHVPRTGGTSLFREWGLKAPEYHGHALPYGESFRYGFTRNPFDRAVSLYEIIHPKEETGRIKFKDWVMQGMPGPAYEGVPICSPSTVWLDGAQFIGRFEHRERDGALLAAMLGRKPPTLHINQSQRLSYQTYYDEETIAVVRWRFRDDFLRFGYGFDA